MPAGVSGQWEDSHPPRGAPVLAFFGHDIKRRRETEPISDEPQPLDKDAKPNRYRMNYRNRAKAKPAPQN